MKKAYLEANIISRAQEIRISGPKLREILGSNGYAPVIGFHTIYELAKTFLNDEKIDVAKNLFEILKGLQPDYSEESKVILFQEYRNYLNGTEIKPFAENEKRISRSLRKTRRKLDCERSKT